MDDLQEWANAFSLGKVISLPQRIDHQKEPGQKPIEKYLITTDKGVFVQSIYYDPVYYPKHLPFLKYIEELDFPIQRLLSIQPTPYRGNQTWGYSYIPGRVSKSLSLLENQKAIRALASMHTLSEEYDSRLRLEGRVILHGDAHPENVVFQDENAKLIDLDFMRIGAPAYDIGRWLFYALARGVDRIQQGIIEREIILQQHWLILDAYKQKRDLHPEDIVGSHQWMCLFADEARNCLEKMFSDGALSQEAYERKMSIINGVFSLSRVVQSM